ncbi:Hypothetical protein FKW44_013585 [Caligus rogercresseyi]|uniref:Uncharacterized protein n=1 Tax=Caligus rogercresseyi TaxID=217165 RepID=A0A7T8GXS1_CALRO|nr:Hypothetical protein FKW44_013585 [Caligus rogercresseyi]
MERASSEPCFERIPAHQGQEVQSLNQTVNGMEESGEDTREGKDPSKTPIKVLITSSPSRAVRERKKKE